MVQFEAATMPLVVVVGCVLAGGVVAGAYCWRQSHHLLGLAGMVAPALLPIAHFLTALIVARVDDDADLGWAPTYVGDIVGLAIALVVSTVVVVLAVLFARTSHRGHA
jgi:hypothetical protein